MLSTTTNVTLKFTHQWKHPGVKEVELAFLDYKPHKSSHTLLPGLGYYL